MPAASSDAGGSTARGKKRACCCWQTVSGTETECRQTARGAEGEVVGNNSFFEGAADAESSRRCASSDNPGGVVRDFLADLNIDDSGGAAGVGGSGALGSDDAKDGNCSAIETDGLRRRGTLESQAETAVLLLASDSGTATRGLASVGEFSDLCTASANNNGVTPQARRGAVSVTLAVAWSVSESSEVAQSTGSGSASGFPGPHDSSYVRERGARLLTLYFSVLHFSVWEELLGTSSLDGPPPPACGMDMLSVDSKLCATDPQMACDRTDPRLRCSVSTPCSIYGRRPTVVQFGVCASPFAQGCVAPREST